MPSKDWNSECSPRSEVLFWTRGEPFRWLLTLTCPPASTPPGEGLPCGLLESSCGRRKRRSILKTDQTSACMPAYYCRFRIRKSYHALSDGGEKYGLPSGETGAGGLAFCYTRNAKGPREPERKGCLTPVEFDWSRRSCKRSTYTTES